MELLREASGCCVSGGRDPAAESVTAGSQHLSPWLQLQADTLLSLSFLPFWSVRGVSWRSKPPDNLASDYTMPSTKQQRARRQTAPSGPPQKRTANETQPSLESTKEDPGSLLKWSIPSWNNEAEFTKWLNGVRDDLVEESYDQYQYVYSPWGLPSLRLIWTFNPG